MLGGGGGGGTIGESPIQLQVMKLWYCLAPPSQGLPLERAVSVVRQGGILIDIIPYSMAMVYSTS